MSTPKVVYIPEQAGSVTLHLTVDEACAIRALIGATHINEKITGPLHSAMVSIGIPKKYKVTDEAGNDIDELWLKERE